MLCVCVTDVMDVIDVVFSVCIVRRGAVCAHVWEVVCLCLCALLSLYNPASQFSMLRSA